MPATGTVIPEQVSVFNAIRRVKGLFTSDQVPEVPCSCNEKGKDLYDLMLIQNGNASLSRGQSLVHEKGEVFCAAGFGLCEISTSPRRARHTHRSSNCREFLLYFV